MPANAHAQIGRMGAVALARAVAGARGLQKLELDDNQISEDGGLHLKASNGLECLLVGPPLCSRMLAGAWGSVLKCRMGCLHACMHAWGAGQQHALESAAEHGL